MRPRPILLLATTVSTLLLALVTLRTPQGVYSDPAYQIDALQEYLRGHSPSMNESVKPWHADLSTDQTQWIIWWPPGTQLCLYPFMKAGMPIGPALRTITLLFLFLGSIGWMLWISYFKIPFGVQLALAVLFPWMRYPSNALFWYSAEIISFGTGPWALLGARWLMWRVKKNLRVSHLLPACGLIVGLLLGFRYVLKYSAVFTSLGLMLYLAHEWKVFKEDRRRWVVFGLTALGCALPVLALTYLNHKHAAVANGLLVMAGLKIDWGSFLAVVANPALALADADGLVRYLCMNPTQGYTEGMSALYWAGIPGGLLLIWLTIRRPAEDDLDRLIRWVFGVTAFCLLLVWNTSKMADHAARHAAGASLMLLPFAIQEGFRLWRERRQGWFRGLLIVASVFYIAAPLAYGLVSVFAKNHRIPKDYVLGPYKIYIPELASQNLWEARTHLLEDFDPDHDVWYLPDPMSAITLPGRTIIRQADFMTNEELADERFVTSKPLRVRVLVPRSFEKNGKAAIIRKSFPQAGPWTRREYPGCNYILFLSTLNATADHR